MSAIMLERSSTCQEKFSRFPQKFDVLFPKRPKSQEREKMTIIAGFQCTTGVVVCADRLITRGDSKYYEQKIKILLDDDLTLAVAGAGDLSLTREVFEKIVENLEEKTPGAVKESADKVLTDMGRLIPYEASPLGVEFIIAASSLKDKAHLFAFSGKGLYTVEDYVFGGVGDSSLVRFLCENLFLPPMTIAGAQLLGTYLVKKAKDYVSGCGGPTDIFGVYDNGKLEQLDVDVTADIERRLDEHEAKILPMLVLFLDLPVLGPITKLE